MYFKDDFYTALLLISATTCALADDALNQRATTEQKHNRIAKRDAAIFIDSFPVEPIYYRSDPTVIYRRVIRRRNKPRPKYGPPRSNYRSVKPKKPYKKNKKTPIPKYGPPSHKNRPNKQRYGPPKPSHKPVYGPPKKSPMFSHYEPESFNDLPAEYSHAYEMTNFGEPPIFDAPLNHQASNIYVQRYKPSPDLDSENFEDDTMVRNKYPMHHANFDFHSEYANIKARPVHKMPETYFDDNIFNKETYKESDKYNRIKESSSVNAEVRKKPYKINKRPNWKTTTPKTESDEEILIGGQYAEPPARYVPKLPSGGSVYDDDEDTSLERYYLDPEEVSSATISPYVNYKNSNMAFSPQNLNDAFSIVES